LEERGRITVTIGFSILAPPTTNTKPVSQPQIPLSPADDSKPDDETATAPLTIQVSAPIVKAPQVETPDLWLFAYERAGFDEEQKKILLRTPEKDEAEPWSPLEFVEEVKDATRERCMECAKSGWVTSDGVHNGTSNVVVAQRAEKVISAVLEMKEFVDQGLKLDATGYGATAWSVITFGLQASYPPTLRVFFVLAPSYSWCRTTSNEHSPYSMPRLS
jgi:hypothetical protein